MDLDINLGLLLPSLTTYQYVPKSLYYSSLVFVSLKKFRLSPISIRHSVPNTKVLHLDQPSRTRDARILSSVLKFWGRKSICNGGFALAGISNPGGSVLC